PEILEKWEINNVLEVIDILGLWGDAVDNIPGIPGVGEKTAKKLIQEFGSIENLIQSTDKLKGKLKENVENFAEQGLISKKLATILLDVPVDLDEKALELEDPNREVLESLFAELEFRTLGKRVFGDDFSIGESPVSKSAQMDLFAPLPENELSLGQATVEEVPTTLNTISTVQHQYILVDQ